MPKGSYRFSEWADADRLEQERPVRSSERVKPSDGPPSALETYLSVRRRVRSLGGGSPAHRPSGSTPGQELSPAADPSYKGRWQPQHDRLIAEQVQRGREERQRRESELQRERERAEQARQRAEQARQRAEQAELLPAPRLLKSDRDAEVLARDWLRFLGWRDAEVTPPGPDGGVDVRAAGLVAQVKMELQTTGAPVLQQLFGVAAAEGLASRTSGSGETVRAAVFSLRGFTRQAVLFAETAAVALFEFAYDGTVEAKSEDARWLLSDAYRRAGLSAPGHPGKEEPPAGESPPKATPALLSERELAQAVRRVLGPAEPYL